MNQEKKYNGLGYYAKSKQDGNLFQYKWEEDNTFWIQFQGNMYRVNPDNYDIIEVFNSVG